MTEPGPARVVEGERAGWRALTLDNGDLRVTVIPDKGAEIVELIDARTGIDVLFHAPWGLQPPGSPPREGSGGHAFLENYGGGWQELFPSAGDPCTYRGRPIPFHGEVASLPWDYEPLGGAAARLTVDCRRTPFRLERVMSLPDGERTLRLEETAVNESADPAHLVWGHHCVVGPPFLGQGCQEINQRKSAASKSSLKARPVAGLSTSTQPSARSVRYTSSWLPASEPGTVLRSVTPPPRRRASGHRER